MARAMLFMVLLWQCWLLYVIDRSWWFFALVLVAVGVGQGVRRIQQSRWRTRSWFIVAMVLVLLAVSLPIRPASSIPFWVVSAELLIPAIRLLLFWLALLVLRPSRPINERATEFALVLGIFGLCMFRPAFDQQRDFYWVLAAAIGITFLVIGRPDPRSRCATDNWAKSLRRQWIPPGARWVFVAANMVVIGTWGMSELLLEVADGIQLRVDQVAESSELMLPTGHRYLQVATLDNVTAEKRNNPMQVALRVYCDVEPGYLRGRAYEFLEGDRWLNSSETRRAEVPLLAESDPPQLQLQPRDSSNPCFRIDIVNCDQWRSVEVRNDPTRGKSYFSPINAAYIQGDGRRASMDVHEIIREGPSTRAPYRFFVPNCQTRESLTPLQRERLLTIPESLSREAQEVLTQITPAGDSTIAKIKAVEEYFSSRYRYSLEPIAFAPRTDRLSQFITEGNRGHCEFFAASAVMALRLMDVPTRFVVGFAVHELEEEDGEFWVGRNRDTHAWAEAYSSESQEWLVVEATPGVEISRNIWDQAARDDAEDEVVLDLNQRDRFGGSRWQWFIPDFSAKSLARISIAACTLFTVGLAVFWLWRIKIRHRRWSYVDAEGARTLRQLDRRLRRRGIQRFQSETLRAFARRLRENNNAEQWIIDAAATYESYMTQRYRPHPD